MSNLAIKQECQPRVKIVNFGVKKGLMSVMKRFFTYNQAMKDYFSRYKFDGDYILRKIFASILKDKTAKV